MEKLYDCLFQFVKGDYPSLDIEGLSSYPSASTGRRFLMALCGIVALIMSGHGSAAYSDRAAGAVLREGRSASSVLGVAGSMVGHEALSQIPSRQELMFYSLVEGAEIGEEAKDPKSPIRIGGSSGSNLCWIYESLCVGESYPDGAFLKYQSPRLGVVVSWVGGERNSSKLFNTHLGQSEGSAAFVFDKHEDATIGWNGAGWYWIGDRNFPRNLLVLNQFHTGNQRNWPFYGGQYIRLAQGGAGGSAGCLESPESQETLTSTDNDQSSSKSYQPEIKPPSRIVWWHRGMASFVLLCGSIYAVRNGLLKLLLGRKVIGWIFLICSLLGAESAGFILWLGFGS